MRYSMACAVLCLWVPLNSSTAQASRSDSVPDSLAFAAMEWREIGPFRGGRSVAVAGSAARPLEYYMGTTGGGVFKTVDGGLSWQAVTDRYFGGTIGAIAVSESNPDVVYVGTGEYPIRGNVSHGEGVYKTTDGGRTWRYVGLAETRQIARIRIHPKNPDVVYVAALGHVWAPNAERGVYRSADGGSQLDTNPVAQRFDRRHRAGDGPGKSGDALRRILAGGPEALAAGERGGGERPLQVNGRRGEVDRAHPPSRPAQGRHRQYRTGGVGLETGDRVGADRGGFRRALPVGRRR